MSLCSFSLGAWRDLLIEEKGFSRCLLLLRNFWIWNGIQMERVGGKVFLGVRKAVFSSHPKFSLEMVFLIVVVFGVPRDSLSLWTLYLYFRVLFFVSIFLLNYCVLRFAICKFSALCNECICSSFFFPGYYLDRFYAILFGGVQFFFILFYSLSTLTFAEPYLFDHLLIIEFLCRG